MHSSIFVLLFTRVFGTTLLFLLFGLFRRLGLILRLEPCHWIPVPPRPGGKAHSSAKESCSKYKVKGVEELLHDVTVDEAHNSGRPYNVELQVERLLLTLEVNTSSLQHRP